MTESTVFPKWNKHLKKCLVCRQAPPARLCEEGAKLLHADVDAMTNPYLQPKKNKRPQ